MTGRQKTVLWRWILSVVVISSLLFLIPEYLLSENLSPKTTWISLDIHSESEILPLKIKHQVIDPLILGLIVWVTGRFCISARPSRMLQVAGGFLLLGILLSLAYIIFYQQNGNTFVLLFLGVIGILGPILKWGSIILGIVRVFHFLVLGIIKYFQDDAQGEESETVCQNEEASN